MPAAKLTTWTDPDKYRWTSAGTGEKYGKLYHVRAVSEHGGRISFLISREAFDRLPAFFDIGHILAEGGEIL